MAAALFCLVLASHYYWHAVSRLRTSIPYNDYGNDLLISLAVLLVAAAVLYLADISV